jgi:hypothetical protein
VIGSLIIAANVCRVLKAIVGMVHSITIRMPSVRPKSKSMFSSARASRADTMSLNQYEDHSRVRRSLRALPTTLTDESAIAAAATMGESKTPNHG